MIRLSYRLTLVCCSLLASVSGCGQDEAVFSKPVTSGEGDGGATPTPPPPVTTQTPPPPAPTGSTSQLAAPCTTDAQCGTGLKCLTATGNDWRGGGAANGFCTAACVVGESATCSALSPGAQCISTSTGDYCLPACTPGTASNPKCQGRADVACDMVTWSSALSGAYCRPMCRGDEDCAGRKCLLGEGICKDALPGEDPVGAGCDPEAEQNSCASGQCIGGLTEGTSTAGYCTGLCTFGSGGCGSTSALPERGGDASCFPVFSGGGRGDIGMCMQTCNCDADCAADKYVCAQVPGAMEALGIEGFCFEFDLAIPVDSGVVLGVECLDLDGGGDAMSHADTGALDASPADATAGDATAGDARASDGSAWTSQPGLFNDGAAPLSSEAPDAADAE